MNAHRFRPVFGQPAQYVNTLSVRRWKIAALLLCAILNACGKKPETAAATVPPLVQLVQVMPAPSRELREFTGRVEQTSISPLAFEVSGRIVLIAVLDGSNVRKGQLIARIDPEPFELQLRRAEAQ